MTRNDLSSLTALLTFQGIGLFFCSDFLFFSGMVLWRFSRTSTISTNCVFLRLNGTRRILTSCNCCQERNLSRFLSFLLLLLRATLLCCLPDISSEKYFHSFHPIHDARYIMNSSLGTLETRRDGCFRRLFLCALCRRRQRGRVVRAFDLQFGGQSPEFKSRSNR